MRNRTIVSMRSLCRSSIPALGACAALLALVFPALADELTFGPPSFLPGDNVIAAAAGMQEQADVAAGGSQFLAVWTDYRSTPDDYPPFSTEGSGGDIYGARLDADGNLIDAVPFVISQSPGDQFEPCVAWNGENWLVVWKQETLTLPTYEEHLAVRVSPSGDVLDSTPIVIHNDESYYSGARVAGGGGGWVVTLHANGPTSGLLAVRVTDDGTVANPGGLLVHSTDFLLDFDLAFAGDVYMIIWSGSFDAPRARRYTPELSLIGTSALPFGQRIATDGTDFLVVRASGSPPLATVDAVRVMHDGTLTSPVTVYTAGGQSGTCCADVAWDGTVYWVSWGGPKVARVSTDGQVLDPNGVTLTPGVMPISQPGLAGAPGGGLQLVYNDGVAGAAYPKDVFGGQVEPDMQFLNETALSLGAPAQLGADFAEGAGIHLLALLSRGSADGRILVQRLDDDGAPLDAEPIEVASGPVSDLGSPTLSEARAAWNGSLFMITWSDGLQVYMRRMLADGTFLDPLPRVVMAGRDPDLAAVGDVFLVVALDYLDDNPHWQATFSMRVEGSTGANLDPESTSIGGFVIFARHPRVESWGDRWLAVWQRNLSHDNTIAGTTAAIVNVDGTTPGTIELPLGWRPQVAVSPDKALFVAVTETIASATTDLEGMIMNADGSFSGSPFVISEAPDKQLRPAVTWNGSEFLAAWEDKRDAVVYFDERTDIYGTRITEDGVVLDPAGVALVAGEESEIQPTFLSVAGRTLMASSILRPAEGGSAYRLGVQRSLTPAGIDLENEGLASPIRLFGVHPNPVVADATIRFEASYGTSVDVRIYDARGALIRTLAIGSLHPAGAVEVEWDGRDDRGLLLPSGVYYYEVTTPGARIGQKLVVVR